MCIESQGDYFEDVNFIHFSPGKYSFHLVTF